MLTKIEVSESEVSRLIREYTNERRKKVNQQPLFRSEYLTEAALLHSKNMVDNYFFAHKDPIHKNLQSPLLRVRHFNGDHTIVGENIAYMPRAKGNIIPGNGSYDTIEFPQGKYILKSEEEIALDVVEAWMRSPGHKQNILSPHYLFIGVGTVFCEMSNAGNKVPYAMMTQNFGGYKLLMSTFN